MNVAFEGKYLVERRSSANVKRPVNVKRGGAKREKAGCKLTEIVSR